MSNLNKYQKCITCLTTIAQKDTTYKFERTTKSTRNFRTLLDYVHMITYNWNNWKRPSVHSIHLYILVKFYIEICFCASLSVRVSDSDNTVKCASKFCTKKPSHKLHHHIIELPTKLHTLLHTPTILHTNTFLIQTITCTRKYCTRQTCHIICYYNHSCFIRHRAILNMTTFLHQSDSTQK